MLRSVVVVATISVVSAACAPGQGPAERDRAAAPETPWTTLFDGVSLANPVPRAGSDEAGTATRLLSGYWHTQTSAVRPYQESFVCLTESWTDVSNIRAKIGTTGRLVITGTDPIDLANVTITGRITWAPWGSGWEYTVTFTQTV
jgi:hypothetical protein